MLDLLSLHPGFSPLSIAVSIYNSEGEQPCRAQPSPGSKGQLSRTKHDAGAGERVALLMEADMKRHLGSQLHFSAQNMG